MNRQLLQLLTLFQQKETKQKLELSENLTIPPPPFSASKAYGWYLRRKMKRERKIQRTTNRRMSIFNPMLLPVLVNQYTKFEVSILNGCGDIFDKKIWRERKRNKYKEEQIGECPFAIPQYNLSLQISIPNLKILS